MAIERLVEGYRVSSSCIKKLPLNESRKVLYENTEYSVPEGYELPMWDCSKKNKNGRKYPVELAKKIIAESITSVGLCDHPDNEGSVKDIFCIECNPHLKGSILYYDLYPVYPYKEKIKDILSIPGGFFECSSSGFGEVNRDGSVDINSYSLERYGDWVLNRSEECAIFSAENLGESITAKSSSDEIISELEKQRDTANSDEEKERMNKLIKFYKGKINENESSLPEVGQSIKYNNTKWKVEKVNGPLEIEVVKEDQHDIFKKITVDDIQEQVVEEKTVLDSTILDTYKQYIKDMPKEKAIDKVVSDLVLDKEEVESVINKKQEGQKPMNKRFSVEEKTFRLSIKNLMKEAEEKEDPQEKKDALEEIQQWFEDNDMAPDMKKEVDDKIENLNTEIKELAKKGLKSDALAENEKTLKKTLEDISTKYKEITEKYDLATEVLDNAKVFSKQVKDLYEMQKGKANGMVTATKFKEALDTVEKLTKAFNESKKMLESMKVEKAKITEELNKTKKALTEKTKFDSLRKLQLKVQEDFEAEKDKEAEDKEAKDKEEADKKEMEEKVITGLKQGQKDEILEYYNDLVKSNSGYKQYKEEFLGKRTLIEAQVFALKIKNAIHENFASSDSNELNNRINLKEGTIERDKVSISKIKRNGYI